jgi:glycosyltransferase involved in cell wall biosynthesis
VQASVAFILEALAAGDGVEWCFALSRQVHEQLVTLAADFRAVRTEFFAKSPAKSRESRRRLRRVEADFAPDAVFTFFGPAYVTFAAPHLCGVADGWATHAGRLAFGRLPIARKIEYALRIAHKAYWYRQADAWVVEAEAARRGLTRRLRIRSDRIAVVPNSCGSNYPRTGETSRFPSPGERVRILCLSAYYPHKNLEIIPRVAAEMALQRPGLEFEFVITLPEESAGLATIRTTATRLGVGRHIFNAGPVPVHAGPDLYRSCHLCFLPSLLETFSANYPEAMAMARPMVTTCLDFARDICMDAARYFDPLRPEAAATVILRLLDDRNAWEGLVERGKRVLAGLPTPREKYERYRELIMALVRQRRELPTIGQASAFLATETGGK